MKKWMLLAFFILCSYILQAQKPALTIEAIKDWPEITSEKISNDGKLVIYTIEKSDAPDTLVIQPVDQRWTKKIPGAINGQITANSRWVIYKSSDSLFAYDVQKGSATLIAPHIFSFKIPAGGNGNYLAWQSKGERKLTLYNLQQNIIRQFEYPSLYMFSVNGDVLLVRCHANEDDEKTSDIKWVNLANDNIITIINDAQYARNFAFDQAAEQLVFITGDPKNNPANTTLYYYCKGMDHAIARVTNATPGLDSNYTLADGQLKFSPNGEKVILSIKKKRIGSRKSDNMPDVNIWHFNDDYLQSEQLAMLNQINNRICTAVLLKGENSIVQLDQENDDSFVELAGGGNGNVGLIRQNINYFAGKWKASAMPAYYAVNCKNGRRDLVVSGREISILISPTGKYILWFDPAKKNYFSYNTASKQIKNITDQLNAGWLPRIQQGRLEPFIPVGIAGWLTNDAAVLIYDQFDIWKVDPEVAGSPVNVTNGYGRAHNLLFRLWNKENDDYATPVINDRVMVLAAFDVVNKNNGFFKKNIDEHGNPVKLSLDPCLYYAHNRFNLQFLTKYPILKAKDANGFILRRMTSNEYPNIYFTRDFKTFAPLSHQNPQQNYNWLTTELFSWQQSDSVVSQGILYKPANFDPKKKYPVIFYFYEQLSHRMHQFLQPEYSSGSIDIPYFVSNGYLVYTPDITYTPGNPGAGVCNSVLSAARYLARYSWVDTTAMGIQGHSFGGYEVNYIVSHTNMFAAAQESSGACDFISYYNGFYREHSAQFYFEYGQGRLGHTLWEMPEAYYQSSPIFNADKVTTPLLIMHNKEDGEVPFQQGIEWFTALRRMGKKVWMLEYDKEYHSINQTKNRIDFTIRVAQFFNHFLKHEPAPKWLVNGVPAILKGEETGLEYTGDAVGGIGQ